ncbi:3'-5' RNA exonuclease complex component [Dimargaris xerosporica]|nr:3'-5' RNA exonuclease complex component [Dimargaris xerosporica]
MLQLVPSPQRKQYLDRLSSAPSPSATQKRTYATKAARKKKPATNFRKETSPQSPTTTSIPTMPFSLKKRGEAIEDLQVLYYPPELYQRLVPAQTPTEAFQIRQLRPQRMGTPVPLSHPLVDCKTWGARSGLAGGSSEELKPATTLTAEKTTADFVDYNDLQMPTQATSSTDPSGSYELTATSTVTLPLEPGDLVDIFAVDQSIPQFGIVLSSSLPETGSSRYQVLTMTHQVLTVTDRSVSFWIPGFIFSNASVLETCWRNYCRDHPRYHISVSRQLYESYLKKGFREGSQEYLAPQFAGTSGQRLAADLQRALPSPDNILNAIPALRFAMNQWRQQIETWHWSHHFHYEGLYDDLWNSVQAKPASPSATNPTHNQVRRPVTQAEPAHSWDSSDWDPNVYVPVETVAQRVFYGETVPPQLAAAGPAIANRREAVAQYLQQLDHQPMLSATDVPPEQLHAIHRHLISHPFEYLVDHRNVALTRRFYLRHPQERNLMRRVYRWVRESAPELQAFITKMRQVLKARSDNTTLVDGSPAEFTGPDRDFVHLLQLYVIDHASGVRIPTIFYHNIVPAMLKPLNRFSFIDKDAVVQLLADLGVWSYWGKHHLLSRILPLPGTGMFPKVDRLVEDIGKEVKARQRLALSATLSQDSLLAPIAATAIQTAPDSVLSANALYDRDIYASIRHDFGDMVVYTLDDANAHEIDDGMSIERDPLTGVPTWIHVHIADPTSLIPPDHPLSNYLCMRSSTLYFPEDAWAMIPRHLARTYLGLESQKTSPTTASMAGLMPRATAADREGVFALTFSAQVKEDGQLGDYTIRPSRLHRLVPITYAEADQLLADAGIGQFLPQNALYDPYQVPKQRPLWHPGAGNGAEELMQRLDHLRSPTKPETLAALGNDTTSLPSVRRDLQDLLKVARQLRQYRVNHGALNLQSMNARSSIQVGSLPSSCATVTNVASIWANDPSPVVAAQSIESYTTAGPWILAPSSNQQGPGASISRSLVAEFMILGGRIATAFCQDRKIPVAYRNQGRPNIDLMEATQASTNSALAQLSVRSITFSMFNSGYLAQYRKQHPGRGAHSAAALYHQTLARARHQGGELSVRDSDILLPLMPAASLSLDPTPGHSMLGLTNGYTRVTSPLRRYLDMVTHWQIKAYLLFGSVAKLPFQAAQLQTLIPEWYRLEKATSLMAQDRIAFWSALLLQRWLHAPSGQALPSYTLGTHTITAPFERDASSQTPILDGVVVHHNGNPLLPVSVHLPSVGLNARVLPSDICRPMPGSATDNRVSHAWDLKAKPLLAGDRVKVKILENLPYARILNAMIVHVDQVP